MTVDPEIIFGVMRFDLMIVRKALNSITNNLVLKLNRSFACILLQPLSILCNLPLLQVTDQLQCPHFWEIPPLERIYRLCLLH